MIDALLDWLGFYKVTGPYVSAAGFFWRFVSHRFERKLNKALSMGYRRGNNRVETIHGYWPVNRMEKSVWLDPPETRK